MTVKKFVFELFIFFNIHTIHVFSYKKGVAETS
jgi:hypothetical protein